MKFRVTFKTPDVAKGVMEELCPHPSKVAEEYTDQDVDAYTNKLYSVAEQMNEVVQKFIQYDELITIEFDTESKTAIVIQVR